MTPIAQEIRARIDKWNWVKLKSFGTSKEIITRIKKPCRKLEKTFACYSLHKELMSRNCGSYL
jgi:hypothetical protein